ncbi:alpha/beta hydrolase [Phyllobacterium meliloti]|uniref:alpha/beta hydrolase n=1 Tax=Phyllobacterium meliloti TaxID=555317 RepID=UPI001D140AEC|nr:alpha/beta hydrolase [Phyllobacterium sp. T1293]UGX88312.1 alpha/beta hydrolase [Phyllobacterium sp. T1293]
MFRRLVLLAAAACTFSVFATPSWAQEATQCPAKLPADTDCYSGQDRNGAFYWIARPKNWNGILVLHAHGGPRLSRPKIDDPVEDLERFAVTVSEGYAWAGSSYRREGYGVRMAAEDTENLRRITWDKLGRPRLTILHGQSWGGNVAAKAAELYSIDGAGDRVYNGVVLTSGVLAGGTRAYDVRADLRVVYQYYCHNNPKPDEEQYPLWQGLPQDAKLSRKELDARVNDCTGVDLPADQRSTEQKQNLANILAVVPVPERTLAAHLAWATLTFKDMIWRRLEGHNPFDNQTTHYTGSSDDDALNKGVERFTADPEGVRLLAYDSDLTGQIVLPTLTMHAKDDPTAPVEFETVYRDMVAKAGNSDLLVQTFTDEHEHSKLSTPQYAAIFQSMVDWIDKRAKPTPVSIDAICQQKAPAYGEPCRFDTAFYPEPLKSHEKTP